MGADQGIDLEDLRVYSAPMGHGGYLRMKTWPDVHSGENMNTGCFRGSRSTRREYVHLPRR
jgi:hypothetical protein